MTVQNDSESSIDENAIFSEERAKLNWAQSGPKGRSSSKVFSAGCIVRLAFMACIGLAIGIFAIAAITAAQNQDEWLALADDFMQAMAEKEIDRAYWLFASPAEHGFTAELASFVDGPYFALFDGYENLAIESWTFNFTYPEGLTVEIAGPIYYQQEFEGIHQFVLVRENGKWKLLAFNVEVPQEKSNAYSARSHELDQNKDET